VIKLADIRCACGSDQIMAVDPGEEEIRDFFLLRRERPAKAWCMSCWTLRFGAQAA
jgi:hypothetical protein